MDSPPLHRPHSSLLTRQQMERLQEPWFLNKVCAIAVGLLLAILFGYLGATGQVEALILTIVWLLAVAVIVFVRDYWWSPALIVTALAFHTYALGFNMTGLEIGVAVLAITFPVKMAMKTLRPVQPAIDPGIWFWLLLSFVVLHGIVILFYNRVEGSQLKNIVRAYYQAITPLILYGLLLRYGEPRTVKPTAVAVFFVTVSVTIVSLLVIFLEIPLQRLTALMISVDWMSAFGAVGVLRSNSILMVTAALAWWPLCRSSASKVMMGGTFAVGAFATLISGSRGTVLELLAVSIVFSVLRKKFWMILIFSVGLASLCMVISANPDVLYRLPDLAHRALTPLNLSGDVTAIQEGAESSTQWHTDLRTRSLAYWTADTNSVFLGHGFKSWDDTYNMDPSFYSDYDLMVTTAIEMGRTENMFSAVTNIFGMIGLILYSLFLLDLTMRVRRARLKSPPNSVPRALSEFSFSYLLLCLVFSPLLGGVPGFELIYWTLGLLAARPFLGPAAKQEVSVSATAGFDRSRDTRIGAAPRIRGGARSRPRRLSAS